MFFKLSQLNLPDDDTNQLEIVSFGNTGQTVEDIIFGESRRDDFWSHHSPTSGARRDSTQIFTAKNATARIYPVPEQNLFVKLSSTDGSKTGVHLRWQCTTWREAVKVRFKEISNNLSIKIRIKKSNIEF